MQIDHKSLDDGYIKYLSFSRVYLTRYHNCEDSFTICVQIHVFHALTLFTAEFSLAKQSTQLGKKML